MIITDEQLVELADTPPEKRAAVLLLQLFVAGILDDDAYSDAIIRADDEVVDFGAAC